MATHVKHDAKVSRCLARVDILVKEPKPQNVSSAKVKFDFAEFSFILMRKHHFGCSLHLSQDLRSRLWYVEV